jgi:RHS repeat-associated protein
LIVPGVNNLIVGRVNSWTNSGASTTYGYDAADEITGVTGTASTTMTYDAAGQIGSFVTTSGGNTTQNLSYTFDAQGNRSQVTDNLAQTSTTLAYDQANRLKSYGATATYQYDGNGLRSSKVVSGTTTNYAWDLSGGLPLMILANNTDWIYGPGGVVLEEIVPTNTVYYYHVDQLGSTRKVTDSTGTVVRSYTFDPWGNVSSTTGTLSTPFQFAGQYTDMESGLFYLRARYYDPVTDQFVSLDPMLASTRNAFGYVADNPLNSTDPTGMANACAEGGCGGICAPFSQCTQPGTAYDGQPWAVANDVVGAFFGACGEAGNAFSRAASGFARDLRGGGSVGARWLRPAARLSRAFEDVPGIGIASIGASVVLGALAGESPEEIFGATAGGFIGGIFGAALIGGAGCAVGVLTGPAEPFVCGGSLLVGAAIGGYFGGLAGGWLGRSVHQGSWAPWSWT